MFTITHDAFVDFIEAMPGLDPIAIRNNYAPIDKQAEIAGAEIAAQASIAELRARQGTPFVVGTCRARADALTRDSTGRLAAIPDLQAWAMQPDGIGRHWINWYVVLLNAWIDQHKAPSLVPMMVEGEFEGAVP